jgi:hypothetical protein
VVRPRPRPGASALRWSSVTSRRGGAGRGPSGDRPPRSRGRIRHAPLGEPGPEVERRAFARHQELRDVEPMPPAPTTATRGPATTRPVRMSA